MATRPGKRPPPELRPERDDERATLPEPADPVLVGRISGAWGVHGWVRIAPFNDPRLSLLLQVRAWWLRREIGRRAGAHSTSSTRLHDPVTQAVRVERAKPHGADEIVAKLEGIDDRETALALEGAEVLLSREQFPAPEAGEVYWADLIGCRVLDPGGESLGTVVAIDDQPAHPVMRLSDEETPGAPPESAVQQRLVPLVPELILSIDLAARVVVADWRRDY